MIPDNGPKDGDFASYVESLSRTQSHSGGQAHPVAPAVHDLHDHAPSPQARPDSSGLLSRTGATRDPIPDPTFHVSGKASSSKRSDVVAAAGFAVRWVLRIVALILIATGIFSVPRSVVAIIVGVLLLSLSFRQAGSRSDRGS